MIGLYQTMWVYLIRCCVSWSNYSIGSNTVVVQGSGVRGHTTEHVVPAGGGGGGGGDL